MAAASAAGGRSTLMRAALVLAALAIAALALAVRADGFVYWANDDGTIASATLDGAAANPTLSASDGRVRGLAVDSSYIYWADMDADTIGRANLNGSGVNESFIGGAYDPLGVAVDARPTATSTGRTLNGTIGRANLNGTRTPAELHHRRRPRRGSQSTTPTSTGPAMPAPSGGPTSTAAAPNRPSSWAPVPGTGPRPRGGGRQHQRLLVELRPLTRSGAPTSTAAAINQDFITGAAEPVGVAVDSTYIYWANNRDNIGRANLDGSSVDQDFALADDPRSGGGRCACRHLCRARGDDRRHAQVRQAAGDEGRRRDRREGRQRHDDRSRGR